MNKFQQGISFSSVDEFLEYLPDNEYKITNKLRNIILDCMPEGKEKLAYNVPFYYQFKRVFFIWPASIPWGRIKERDVVTLGFCQGIKMEDPDNILNKGERKEIATMKFSSVKDIDVELIRSYIYEALYIDEMLAK